MEKHGSAKAIIGISDLAVGNFFGGNSSPDFKIRDIFSDNGAGGNSGSPTDGDSGKNNDSWPDEDIIRNGDGAEGVAVIRRIKVVFVVVNQGLAGDADVVADSKWGPTVEETVVTDDGVVTDGDVDRVKKISPHMDG